MTTKGTAIAAIGNVYVETNYLGLVTDDSLMLKPGKEYRASSWEVRPGGSVVNFAVQTKRLGGTVGLIGKVGDDGPGHQLFTLLKEYGIAADLVKLDKNPAVQTSVDTGVILKGGENIQLVAGNANQTLSVKDINLQNPFFDTVGAVYLGGFLKQTNLFKDYPMLLGTLAKRGMRIFLDHGRIPVDATKDQFQSLADSMQYVEGYFPNLEELLGLTKQNDLTKALEIALRMGPKIVVVKLGKGGCRIKNAHTDITVPGHVVTAVSTVGAGDAFNAGFLSQYLTGVPLKESGEFANATAALRVSTNVNPTTEQVLQFLGK
ncbi:MAG: carbohydrate kinase family protein [Patescibacteria group bacterium]|jgi:sugar/nucleoside kinase (ribokinase family)